MQTITQVEYTINDIETGDIISIQKNAAGKLIIPSDYYSEFRWLVVQVVGNKLTLKHKNEEHTQVHFKDFFVFEALRFIGGCRQQNYPNG